jgi:hypothetical protein
MIIPCSGRDDLSSVALAKEEAFAESGCGYFIAIPDTKF